MWQALIILEPYLNEEYAINAINQSFRVFNEVENTLSVRYLIEWFLTRLLLRHPSKIESLYLRLIENKLKN